jgi:hypothetical protein
MRTVLPGQSSKLRPKVRADSAPVSVHAVTPRWYSKEYFAQIFAKRPAQLLALVAFVAIATILIYVFAAGQETTNFGPTDFASAAKNGTVVNSSGGVQLATTGGGAVTKVGQVTASSATGSVSAGSTPGGTTASSTLVAQVLARGSSSITAPSGWTTVGSSNDGTNIVQSVFRAAGNASNLTFSSSGAAAMEVVLSSWNGVTSVSAAQTDSSTAMSGTATAPALGGVSSGAKVLNFFGSTAGPLPFADNGVLLGVSPNGAGNDSGTQAGITSFENVIGRQVAFNHHYLGFDFSSLFPGTSTTSNLSKQMTADFTAGRLSYVTYGHSGANSTDGGWPTATGNGAHNSADTALQEIQAGQYDCVLIKNAVAMRTWGQPIIFRMWHEMNQDMPWSELQSTGAWSSAQYTTYFLNSWRRVYTLTKGTDAQMAALSPAPQTSGCSGLISGGHSVGATNVLFHWNPGKTDSSASVPQDNLYPGDAYVDFAGVEFYSSPGKSDTLTNVAGHSNTTYGQASSHNGKILGEGGGEGGGRLCVTSGCTNAANAQSDYFNSIGTAINGGAYKNWKFLIYWDSKGPVGDNELESHQGGPQSNAVAAFKSVFSEPIFNPTLDNTWFDPTGVTDEYQLRRATGEAHVNYGPTQLGAMLTSGTSGSAVSADSVGFGHWATLTVALQP